MIIKLTEQELSLATRIASLRSGSKSHLDSREVRSVNNPPSMIRHLLGVKCELVVANLFDTVIDMSFKHAGDKNSPDVYLPDGKGIQVKGKFKNTVDKSFALRTVNITEFVSDYGVLCTNNSPSEIEILGYFSKQTFIDKSIIKTFEWGPKRVLEVENLSPISELVSQYKEMSWKSYLSITSTNTLSYIRDLYPTLKNKKSVAKMSRSEVKDYLYSVEHALYRSFSKFGNFEKPVITSLPKLPKVASIKIK